MKTSLTSLFVTVCVLATPVRADPTRRGALAVGAEAILTGGRAAAALIYDAGDLRVDGLLGFENEGTDMLLLGGRVLFPLHSTRDTDLSAGPGLSIVHFDPPGPDNSDTQFHVEGLVQIRAFIASNVALSVATGLAFVIGDGDDTVALGGQVVGAGGIAYYFK